MWRRPDRGRGERLTRKQRVGRVRRHVALTAAAVLGSGLLAWSVDAALGAIVAIACAAALVVGHLLRELGSVRIALAELESLAALAPLRGDEAYPVNPAALSPENALHVCREVLLRRPRTVLELGSGSSSVLIGRCLETLGGEERRLVSVEHDADWLGDSRRRLERAGLEKRVTLLHAPLREQAGLPAPFYDLSRLPEDLPPIELVLVDGPPGGGGDEARYGALPVLAGRLAPGAVLLVDDALREGETRAVERWQREHPGLMVELLASRDGLWRVELPGAPAPA